MTSTSNSNSVSNLLQSHTLLALLNNNTKRAEKGDNNNNFIFMMLFTTIFATSLPIIITQIGNIVTYNLSSIIKRFKSYYRNPDTVEIRLSYVVVSTKYGNCKTRITKDIIGILNYIRINIYKLKGLYALLQDACIQYWNEDDSSTFLPIYRINQDEKIVLWKDGNKTLYIQTTTSNDDINEKDKTCSQTTTLILSSETMSLKEIDNFIKLCSREYTYSKIDDDRKYIFTLSGFDSSGEPIFRKEEFIPYSDFKNIYSDEARKIQKRFDFFVSEEGQKWYKHRNLPYHLSIMLHGIPGTGKSAISSAIAKRYNLHTVRIKLSSIKTNKEFISAFKCRKFSSTSRKYKYSELLYLFDEIDTETNNILLDRKYKNSETKTNYPVLKHISETKTTDLSKIELPIADKLSLGTILEEISGINQMWGRKLIFISNYPERIDAALLRAGRMNEIIQLKPSTRKDTISILKNFFECEIPEYVHRYIPDGKYTPAEIVDFCSSSKNFLQFIHKIRENENADTDNTEEENLVRDI